MKKILITGGTGFLGSHLVEKLKSKYQIYLIIKNNKKIIKNHNNIKKIYFKKYSDLNLKLKKLKIDIVIHCATHYKKDHKYKDIEKIISSNILFGNVLLENLKLLKPKKFINFTTVWENYNGKYGNAFNLYAASKQAFANIIRYYSNLNKKTKFYNLFISDTYGYNDKRIKLINVIKKNISKNKELKLVSKNLSINLTNVRDIISAVDIVIKKKIKPGNYLLKNNKNFLLQDIINQIKIFKKLKIKWLSKNKIAEKIYNIKKLPHWKPKFSNKKNLIKFVINNESLVKL